MQPLPQYTVHKTLNRIISRTFLAQFGLVSLGFPTGWFGKEFWKLKKGILNDWRREASLPRSAHPCLALLHTWTLEHLGSCTLLLWTHNTLLHCICAWNWVIDRMISALLSVQHCGEDCMRKCSHAWSGSSADPWENSYPTLVNRLHKESASRPWRQIRLPIQRETLAAWERQHLLWCGVDCPHSCQAVQLLMGVTDITDEMNRLVWFHIW